MAIYEGTRIPGAGNVALFMQTTPGLIVCVVCPILLLVGYDMIRRRMYEKSTKKDADALLAELEELRRRKAGKEQQEAQAFSLYLAEKPFSKTFVILKALENKG